MATKQQVIDTHKQHPRWTCSQIARKIGCMPEYVHACKRRYLIPIPRSGNRYEDPQSILSLGQAARAAGLTLEMIERMGAPA